MEDMPAYITQKVDQAVSHHLAKQHRYIIGIDPGTKTGFAVYDRERKFLSLVTTFTIHEAMLILDRWTTNEPFVRVEDARQRTWFGNAGRDQLQGAGSIKRDCAIWEDFLQYLGFDYELVAPKRIRTKMSADAFRRLTGYEGRTSEHARDAALLCYQY